MRNSGRLGVSFRVTFAAVLSLVAANALGLNLPLWAVLTALIVTQISTGRSLKATIDYLVGTFCGAVFGALIALFIPHASEAGLISVLTLAIAPLVLLAAMTPSFAVGPATAVIVILLPTITHGSSTASALDRIMEVSLGGFIGLVVSYFVLPSHRSRFATDAMSQAIEELASGLHDLSTGAITPLSGIMASRREKLEMVLGQLDALDPYSRRRLRASSNRPLKKTWIKGVYDVALECRRFGLPIR